LQLLFLLQPATAATPTTAVAAHQSPPLVRSQRSWQISITRLNDDVCQQAKTRVDLPRYSSPVSVSKLNTFSPPLARRHLTLRRFFDRKSGIFSRKLSATNIPVPTLQTAACSPPSTSFPAGGFTRLLSIGRPITVAAHTWLELSQTYSHIHCRHRPRKPSLNLHCLLACWPQLPVRLPQQLNFN